MKDANSETHHPQDEAVHGGGGPQGAAPFFSAVLTPYRSLTPRGFFVLMVVLCGVSFVAGLFCIAIGAWPVFGFFGLDVALVWFAFRRNYRDARAYEEVHVSVEEVVLKRVSARGETSVLRFNPVWVRLALDRIEDEGVTRLRLRSHGREVPLGDFLNPVDREDFSRALGAALASARSGRPA